MDQKCCHADIHTFNWCCTRGESEEQHAGKKACKQEIYTGFEIQGRHHQKSKTGVSLTPRKGFMSSNFFLKMSYKFQQNSSNLTNLINPKTGNLDCLRYICNYAKDQNYNSLTLFLLLGLRWV